MKPDRTESEPRKSGGLINIKEKRPPTEDATLSVRVAGSVEAGDVRVFLGLEVFEELERRVMRTPDSEWCGLLLGDLYRSTSFDYLEVEGFLPLRDANARFTQETWEAIYAELDRRKSETNIIGWFFSDPSGNLALEGYRQFVQESFFDDPYQVAMGIDPNSGRYRFFEWKEGELAPLQGHYVFATVPRAEEVRRLAGRPLAEVRSTIQGASMRPQSRRPPASSLWKNMLLLLVTLLSIGELVWIIVLRDQVDAAAASAEKAIAEQKQFTTQLEQVSLAAKAVSDRVVKHQAGGVSESRFNNLERLFTDLQRNYTKMKIQLDRSLSVKEPPKPDKTKDKDKDKGKPKGKGAKPDENTPAAEPDTAAPAGPDADQPAAPEPAPEPAVQPQSAAARQPARNPATAPRAATAASASAPAPSATPRAVAPNEATQPAAGPGGVEDSQPPAELPPGSEPAAEAPRGPGGIPVPQDASASYETPLTSP